VDDDDHTHNDAPVICRATRADGEPCTVRALADGYCFAHSQTTASKRHTARATGGRNKGTGARLSKVMPASLKPILEMLMTSVSEVHAGDLDPRQASGMASLASAIGRLYETAEIEQRLEALEKSGRYGDVS